MKAKHGEPLRYLLEHMRDGCCTPWPYAKQSAGYPHLRFEGKTTLASRIVCSMVNGPPPDEKSVVRHSCGKGHLGCFNAECLLWGTNKQNTHDAIEHGTIARGERVGTSKLTELQMLEIRALCGTMSQTKIAARFGVSQTLVSLINSRGRWSHVS